MSTSAWGIEHGEVSKGFGSAVTGLARKLPGGELRHAKKQLQHQLIKPKTPHPDGGHDFLNPRPRTPIGPGPSLGNQGRTVRTTTRPSYATTKSPAEAGWRPSNRRMT